MNIFRIVYSWFNGWYGQDLYDYLKGLDCNGELVELDLFFPIGIWTMIVIAIITAAYYYIPRGKFNLNLSWFIVLAAVCIVGWGIGFGYTYHKYSTGEMPNWVVYGVDNVYNPNPIDEYGDQAECNCIEQLPVEGASEIVGKSDCSLFGLANAVISLFLYIIYSFLMRLVSVDCRHTPRFFKRNRK